MTDLSTNVETVLKTAPSLGASPGTALSVATTNGDVQGTAEAVAGGANAMADSTAKARVAQSSGGGLSGALNWLGNHIAHAADDVGHDFSDLGKAVVGGVGKILSAPLNFVQHEYRYLHDVEASHGMLPAILEGLGVAAGAAGGFLAGGVPGAEMGAEAVTGLEGQVFYRDSWQRTGSASYVDPHTHQPVSLGRDLMSEFGHLIPELKPGTTSFKITSGLVDGIFDLGVGGSEYLNAYKAVREGTLGGAIGAKLGDRFAGVAPQNPEDVLAAYAKNGDVRRAFDDLGQKSASDIAATPAYEPIARQADLLKAVGGARNGEEVAQVFADALQTHNLVYSRQLPTMAATRIPFAKLREAAESVSDSNLPGVIKRPANWFAIHGPGGAKLPDAWNDVEGQLKTISSREFNPASKLDNGAVGLYHQLLYTESPRVAKSTVQAYINAPDLESRVHIVRQAQLGLLFKAAKFTGDREGYLAQFANPTHQEAMARVLDDLVGGGMFGKEANYGFDDQGHSLSLVKDAESGWQYGAAIHPGQTGMLRFLDPSEVKRAGMMLKNAQKILNAEDEGKVARSLAGGDLGGRASDFLYHKITQGIFKPLVLLTPSYAMHISLAELIPNILRLGVRNMVRDGLAINIGKLGDKGLIYEDAQNHLANSLDKLAAAEHSGTREDVRNAEIAAARAEREARLGGYESKMDQAVSGLAWRMLDSLSKGKVRELVDNPEALAKSEFGKRIQLAARYIEYNDGYTPSALLSGHYSSTELKGGREEMSARLMRHGVGTSGTRLSDTYKGFGPTDDGQIGAWQSALKMAGNDRASQVGARALREELARGTNLDLASARAAEKVAAHFRGSGRIEPGAIVHAADRQNYGRVISVDGDSALVHFVNKTEGTEARVRLPLGHLTAGAKQGDLDWALRSNPNRATVSRDGRPYVTSFNDRLPDGMDQYDDWARVIVADLRGLTRGLDGKIHDNLLEHIQNGDWADREELSAIPSDSRPLQVPGAELIPDGTSSIQRFANTGFRRVLNPMVNFLSRQPIAFAQFEKEWAHLEPAIARGQVAEDEAMTLAMNRTVRNVIRNVHNIHDRTQWTATARNWMPFYFAQEQAYRRFGRLLAENPAAFRKYALMIANIHDVGQLFQGPNGQGYFVLPGTGWMPGVVATTANTLFGGVMPVETSTPVGMGWNLSSSSVIFPLSAGVRPDVGPLVAVPVQAISQMFPEMGAPALKADVTGAANAVLGGAASSEPIWSQLIPNTIAQRVATAIDPGVNERSFDSVMMQTMQTLAFEHRLPPPDAGYMKWQQFIDRVKNQTRVMYVVKALLGAVTPVSPEISDVTYDKFSGELANDIQKYGSLNKGVTEFLLKNPDATPFTVFQSYSPSSSTPPDSVEAQRWIDNNSDFISKYPYASFYFMPQLKDNKYNATVYNEQLAQGYRLKYNPEANPVGNIGSSFLAQLYISAGNAFVLDNPDNYPAYKKEIASQTGSEKYQTEQQWYNQFIPSYGAQNPVWYEWWNSNNKASDRTQAINEVKQIIASGELPNPKSSQSQGIVGLMNDYESYQSQLSAGYQSGFVGEKESAINQSWDDYLTSVAQDNPELRPFINGVFLTLPAKLGGTGNG